MLMLEIGLLVAVVAFVLMIGVPFARRQSASRRERDAGGGVEGSGASDVPSGHERKQFDEDSGRSDGGSDGSSDGGAGGGGDGGGGSD